MVNTNLESNGNRTFAQNIVRAHTPDALDGYTVVVCEKTGESGESFRYQLKPGDSPPKTALNVLEFFGARREGPAYVAFAVNDHPQLRTTTTASITTDDQKHSFTVTITLGFRVENPRLVVAHRTDDPIEQLHTEAAALVSRALARCSWDDLRNRFRDVEEDVQHAVLPKLIPFGESYGFYVMSLSLSCHLGEQDLRLIEQEREAALATERRKVELQQLVDLHALEAKVQAQERQTKVFNAAAEAAAAAIGNVPDSIHSVAELAKSFETFARYSGNSGEFARRMLEDAGGTEDSGGASTLVAEMMLETEKISWRTVDDKRHAQSAILHLIAELIPEESDSARIERERQRVAQLTASMADEQKEKIRRFSDTEWLREQLW